MRVLIRVCLVTVAFVALVSIFNVAAARQQTVDCAKLASESTMPGFFLSPPDKLECPALVK